MLAHDTTFDCLNSLLRGELAATETYQQAIARLDGGPGLDELRMIHAEHREAANTWRQQVHRFGGKPDQGSGAWGVWARLVEGSAKALGTTAALTVLKEGEDQGVKDYDKALRNETLPGECKSLIIGRLLPQTRSHVQHLDRILASV
jgi:hypothetical protein